MEELKLVDKGLWQCWGCENRNKYVDLKRVEPICKINGDTIMNWVFVPCYYFKLAKAGGGVMNELKPCPFCGKDVEIVKEGDYVEIVCDDCEIAMSRGSYAELIKAWNKRAGG